MKAFEKEWKKTLIPDKFKVIAEAYWRAALERVLSEIHEHREAMDFIEEELGEE